MASIEQKYRSLTDPDLKINSRELFEKYQQEFISLCRDINKSDLLSSNESIDEIPVQAIKYLLCECQYAKFVDSYGMIMFDMEKGPERRNKFRLVMLNIIEGLIASFLKRINEFGFLKNHNGDVRQEFKHLHKWIEAFLDSSKSSGKLSIDSLEREIYASSGPVGRREAKIEKWNLEKMLREDVKPLIELDQKVSEENDDDLDLEMEEELRSLWIKKTQLCIIESVSLLESGLMEKEMLEQMVKIHEIGEDDDNTFGIQGLSMVKDSDDSRLKKDDKFDKGFTDKVETLPQNQPLLSKEGKVLKPFTIVSSNDQRNALKSKVFGTGQELPTMTVEELVDYEIANGGMVKPQEPEPEVDEDDHDYQDKETYRLREWDEFTDTHKKGSGNTMGNLG